MVFVVYGHLSPELTGYFVFTSPVKISLFFAISGYVFNYKNKSTKVFFYKLLRNVAIPWLVLTIGPKIAMSPIKGINWLGDEVYKILTGESFWYMPCMIIAEILWFFINKLFNKLSSVSIASVAVSAAGFVLAAFDVPNFLMINTALIVQIYLLTGLLYKSYDKQIAKKPVLLCGAGVYVLLGVLTLVFYPGHNIDIHLNKYYNYAICLLMIGVGLICLFILADTVIKKYPRIVVLVGQNTLVTYLFHGYVVKVVLKALSIVKISKNWFISIFVTIVVCLVCTVISIIIRKVCPPIMGARRKTEAKAG